MVFMKMNFIRILKSKMLFCDDWKLLERQLSIYLLKFGMSIVKFLGGKLLV